MSRSIPEVQRVSGSTASPDAAADQPANRTALRFSSALEFWLLRVLLVAGITAVCYELGPFRLRGASAAGFGFLLALVMLLAELRLRRAGTAGLLGGALGALLGMFLAVLATLVISRTAVPEPTRSFLEFAALFAFAYLGLVLGSARGGQLKAGPFAALLSSSSSVPGSLKLLDTSVLIDGRIADVCQTQFVDGVLGVPRFVLHELQLVADSADSLKRQRGRRGLEVLQHLQKMPHLDVRILEKDLPTAGEVDHKLLILARRLNAKIVTNDFNLNKVATVQGLAVLNVNQLANALKPVVLPGEPMRVLILREGKEPNQGVAFLDDGTMVVVDGARRLINKRVDMLVTSVHQTTAGKMIFGRLDEPRSEQRQEQRSEARPDLRNEQAAPLARHAAAGATNRGESGGNSSNPANGKPESSPRSHEPHLDRSPRPFFPEPNASEAE